MHQAHEIQAAALKDLQDNMTSEADKKAGVQPSFEIRAGNKLLDQFNSVYWCVAFCYLFPYANAGPDVYNVATASDAARLQILSLWLLQI